LYVAQSQIWFFSHFESENRIRLFRHYLQVVCHQVNHRQTQKNSYVILTWNSIAMFVVAYMADRPKVAEHALKLYEL